MLRYNGSLETEIKDVIRYNYGRLNFLNPPLRDIKEEYYFDTYSSRVDFLGETEEGYVLIECKDKLREGNIGQILRYKTLLKHEKNIGEENIKTILIGKGLEKPILAAIKDIDNIMLIQWDRYLGFDIDRMDGIIDKLIYHFFSPINKSLHSFLEIELKEDASWGYISSLAILLQKLNNHNNEIDMVLSDLQNDREKIEEEIINCKARKGRLEEEYEEKANKLEEEYNEKRDKLREREAWWERHTFTTFEGIFVKNFNELNNFLDRIKNEREALEETAKKVGIKIHNVKMKKTLQKLIDEI